MKPKSTIIDGLGKSSIIFCAIRPESGRHACMSDHSTAVQEQGSMSISVSIEKRSAEDPK